MKAYTKSRNMCMSLLNIQVVLDRCYYCLFINAKRDEELKGQK